MKFVRCARIVIPLLCLLDLAAAQCQTIVTRPVWHTGDWWRVRVPHVILLVAGRPRQSGDLPAHDSPTDASIYRYTVTGQEKLQYEEQEGPRHIGQRVPAETCWVIRVEEETDPVPRGKEAYLLWFRVADGSLRQIVHRAADGKRRDGDFVYSSTHIDDDDPNKPRIVRYRGPTRESGLPLPLQYPAFPLIAAESEAARTKRNTKAIGSEAEQSVASIQIQAGSQKKPGLRVTIGKIRAGTVIQDWAPGYPWWITAEHDGLQKSRLIETNQGPVP